MIQHNAVEASLQQRTLVQAEAGQDVAQLFAHRLRVIPCDQRLGEPSDCRLQVPVARVVVGLVARVVRLGPVRDQRHAQAAGSGAGKNENAVFVSLYSCCELEGF